MTLLEPLVNCSHKGKHMREQEKKPLVVDGVPEEFMKLVEKFCCVDKTPLRRQYNGYYNRSKNEIIPSILEYWRIGGITGGNCWGDEANESVSADDEPDYAGLDELLLEIAPNTTFLQYKKMLSAEQTYEYTEYEYYGNRYYYKVKYIRIKDLYDILKKFGHVK